MASTSNSKPENSSLQLYFKEIASIEYISKEKEQALAIRIQKGDKDALQLLVNSHLRLVAKIARVYTTSVERLQDFIQEGNIGLITAAKSYNPEYSNRFSTYAMWYIHHAMFAALQTQNVNFRIPSRYLAVVRRMHRTYIDMSQEIGRMPTISEVADRLGIKRERLEKIAQSDLLHSPIDSQKSQYYLEIELEDSRYTPDQSIVNENMRNVMEKALQSLTRVEREVIKYRYAFFPHRLTFKEIAEKMKVSYETVRRWQNRALQKLRNRIGEHDLF